MVRSRSMPRHRISHSLRPTTDWTLVVKRLQSMASKGPHWKASLPTVEERLQQHEAVELLRSGRLDPESKRWLEARQKHSPSSSHTLKEEDLPAWQPSAHFSAAAKKQYAQQPAKEQVNCHHTSRRAVSAAKHTAPGVGFLRKMTSNISVEPIVNPDGGHFDSLPVIVEMCSPAPGCAIEFWTNNCKPKDWRKWVTSVMRQPLCRYRQPVELEEPGEWTLHARVRHLSSDKVGPWRSFCFRIDSGKVGASGPVLRCIIRTQLNEQLPAAVSRESVLEEALAVVLEDTSLAVHVRRVFYSWPQLDVHYAVSSSGHSDGFAADGMSGNLHPIEEALNKLRTDFGRQWAAQLKSAGVKIHPSSTMLLGGTLRTMTISDRPGRAPQDQINSSGPQSLLEQAPTSGRHSRWNIVLLQALFAGKSRLRTKMQYAHEAGLFEGLFELSPSLFRCVVSFL